MTKSVGLLSAALLAASALVGPARADWVYTFTGTGTYPGHVFPSGGDTQPFDMTLRVTNAAVRAGRFDLHGVGISPLPGGPLPSYRGDLADFVSFAAPAMNTATPTRFADGNLFDIAMTIDPATGAILSDAITADGPSDGATVSGDQALTSGLAFSDGLAECFPPAPCTVTGSWTEVDPPSASSASPVPEPGTAALLAVPFAALLARRRRQEPTGAMAN